MASVHRKTMHRRFLTPLEWPSTPEIDGFTWEAGPEPSKADRTWAAENLNGDGWHDQDEPVPDEVYDLMSDEAEARDRIERGIPFV